MDHSSIAGLPQSTTLALTFIINPPLFLKLLQTLKAPSTSSPKFRTPGMKQQDKFDGENLSKLRGFLQSCKFLFSNEPTVFSDDCKKVLYAALYLGGRASQWFEPYLDLLKNQSPSCLINNWDRFEQQLFTLFGDPNEDNGKASTYIAQFRTLQSRVDWKDAAFTFHFRKGLLSRITNKLALTAQRLKTLQKLIDRTIELDNYTNPQKSFLRNLQPLSPLLRFQDRRDPLKLPWSTIKKANSTRINVQEGKRRDFFCIVVGNMSWTLVSKGLHEKLPNWQKNRR
ncbi:uncharacterized protein VP01_5889g2 [Puccinia sorghi]|uniref:Retrotransposon gag domain-containing protein n=1 Tax=Puccinia sorghi TaxID=27349 RepID=A0A0L6UIM3_9BASI|nr:uncharacterized protein VP01_5889g2 [Puccinia sorghi]